MSDEIEDRVRQAQRAGVPPAPEQPGYGQRIGRLARGRRTRGCMAVGAAGVVAVIAVVSGVPLVADPRTESADAPPVAVEPSDAQVVPAASCDAPPARGEDTALPDAAVVEVRLCDGVPWLGRRPAAGLAPTDSLVGQSAQELVERVGALPIQPRNMSIDCFASRGAFRFVVVAADSTTSQVLQEADCDFATVDNEPRLGSAMPAYLELLRRQRADAEPPTSVDVRCPSYAGSPLSTVGAGLPTADDGGVTVLLCRSTSRDEPPRLVRELEVTDSGERSDVIDLLAHGEPGPDPCLASDLAPPRFVDSVVVADAWGDVFTASTFRCFAYTRPGSWGSASTADAGSPLWPRSELQEKVAELLDR